MKKNYLLLVLAFVSTFALCQENVVTLSGGYSFANIEDADANANGFRINGLYEFNPYFDQNNQAAKQASQMIWYFIEGFANRKTDDYPSENNNDFLKYIVKLESSDHEVIFWKSKFSNKWWMEIPQKDLKHNKYFPCSYKDYENAMKDELPDKWMKVYGKLN